MKHNKIITTIVITAAVIILSTVVAANETIARETEEEVDNNDNRIAKKVHVARKVKAGSKNVTATAGPEKKTVTMRNEVQQAAMKGLQAMINLYEHREPEILRAGDVLAVDSPGALLAMFSAPYNESEQNMKGAYAAIETAKILKKTIDLDFTGLGRQNQPRISLKRTSLEGICPPRSAPRCIPASRRYRTHDGTCNNMRHPRWGSAQMPFHRFLHPVYSDGIDDVRLSADTNRPLPSARFVSLLVHGGRDGEAPVTMVLPQWGQFIDHDLTSTAQPRSINGSIPKCCETQEAQHPFCLPISVPRDDPWLAPLGVQCLEFLRSAPAQRPDCFLSWREQTNQATSYLDASMVYSSNIRTSDNSRIFRDGMLLFGRGVPREDVCLRGALANQCIRPGDGRSGEQPGLLAMHTVWVAEHNRIASELVELNSHWSDEKLFQEARRIVGAMIQHITYREFLPLVLGRPVSELFDLMLLTRGYYKGYDSRINPTVANSFGAAAFRFGHSLVQGSFIRTDRNHRVLSNNVSLHEEFSRGDTGSPGSLHRLLRGMANQNALMRDEFITPELTNHLFQSGSFPFGLDLAAINIQRGRDHGLPSYTDWRTPCGLTEVNTWSDLENVVGPRSMARMRQAYRSVEDIDLFVGGLAERPVIGGLVGPTFACIIAQQFSNARKGDRFWYENPGLENSFTPAQLQSLRQVTLAQVLCRQLGGGTLQPNVMQPHTIPGNERKLCGVGAMAGIDLLPWTERDPFNKKTEEQSPSFAPTVNINFDQKKPTIIELPSDDYPDETNDIFPDTNTDNVTINTKLDFEPNKFRPTLQTRPLTSNNINNKIEILHSPTSALITNNKLDLKRKANKSPTTTQKTTTKPKTKRKRRTTTTTTKPKTNNKRDTKTKLQSTNRRMDDDTDFIIYDDDDDTIDTQGTFLRDAFINEDNATVYKNNMAFNKKTADDGNINIYSRPDVQTHYGPEVKRIVVTTPSPDSYRIEINIRKNQAVSFSPSSPNYSPPNSHNYQYSSRPSYPAYPPTSYPPYYPTSTPFSYDINASPTESPSWTEYNGQYQQQKPNRPISIFSSHLSQVAGKNISVQNHLPSNFYDKTTRKPELQTFFTVETTKKTTPVPYFTRPLPQVTTPQNHYNIPNRRPDKNHPTVHLTPTEQTYVSNNGYGPSSAIYYEPNYNGQQYGQQQYGLQPQYGQNAPRPMYGLGPFSNSAKSAERRLDSFDYEDTTLLRPVYNDKYNTDNITTDSLTQFDMDGYLRPQFMTFNHSSSSLKASTYHSSNYPLPSSASQPTATKDFNTFSMTATESPITNIPHGGGGQINDKLDEFLTDAYPRRPNLNIFSDYGEAEGLALSGSHKKQNRNPQHEISIVPFKILTSPERPDNWVMFDAPAKQPLPEIPDLTADPASSSSEIPKPMTLGR